MIPFGLAGAGEPVATDRGLEVDVPDGWRQGRTAHGGWSAIFALASARWLARNEGLGQLPPLRSATVNLIGPITGRVEARPRLLRRGRNAVWIAAELGPPGGSDVWLTATFVFMNALASTLAISSHPAPAPVPPPEECPVRIVPDDAPAVFLRRFESRLIGAMSDYGQSSHARWLRLLDRTDVDPEAELLAMADWLLPGAANLNGRLLPVSSMTWHINLIRPATASSDGWWLARVRALHAAEGISTEQSSVWDRDGNLAAIAHQAVAVFG
ncbi:MAG TPA: thioesterase family protein [Novosphingobium sp.]|nr:thioesterase family protein [Novosphingobium sp.]